ncbi:MAG: peptidyl-prolyl cis-trans isomerase [Verrucomicrobiota bacterium]|nr:peptidyl-prolyl cis-trans isomerase [Verrucomicrobiota bacterium]
MITVLRKHHRWLMIVIAILAIPFCFYFTKTDLSAARSDHLGTIYGRTVTRVEFQRNARLVNLARDLGMMTLLQDLTSGATSETTAYAEFTWNRLVLRHEAERLGVRPTSDEIVEFVRTLRPFRNETGFDINKYNEFTQTALPSLGFTEAQIEELASDQLSLDRVKDLLGAGVHLAESESKQNYEQAYGKMQVAVVRLRNEDFAKDVKISDEDITKYFEAHKEQLKTDEKRRVEFVAFGLNEAEKKLTGKERVDALQKLADRANDFSQTLLDKNVNFGQAAAKFSTPLEATGEFTAAAPDPKLAVDPQLAQYAFQLTAQEPYSDAIQVKDGFYIMHLAGKTDARPLTLDEARPKVVEALKNERTRELAATKGAQVANQLRDAIKAGTPIDAAAQQLGLKAERIPPFSLVDNPLTPPLAPKDKPPDAPDLPAIKSAVGELSPGEATDYVPSETGGLVAVLEKREPIDPASYEQGKALFDARYIRNKRSIAFYEWLRDRRGDAKIQPATTAG